jgi:aminoglycoside phosphotransferase (APT) family kinase protein
LSPGTDGRAHTEVVSAVDLDAYRRSAPDPAGLPRLALALDAGAVAGVRLLEGGAACSVHKVDLTSGPYRSVVLKRFPPGHGAAELEWQALRFASRCLVASPDPLAFDPAGAWFGTPAIVMSALPGHLVLTPDDEGRWTAELASALAAIHSTGLAGYPAVLNRPAIWERVSLAGPAGDERSKIAATAITALRQTRWERVFCHCDFHPGNTLYLGGRLVGVCDWASARVAPALSDVGRCRAALSVWPGGRAPDLFRDHYARLTGRPMQGLALWDLFSAYLSLQSGPNLMSIYDIAGVDLTVEMATARASALADRAAAEAGLLAQ